jgi:1-acyl-sn-glycerol-3-phosphate acyltransferase
MLKNIFLSVWSLWALLLFIISLLLVYPVYLIHFQLFRNNSLQKSWWLSRLWAFYIIHIFLIRIKAHQKGNKAPGKEPYIIICNHRSLFDIPLSAAILKNHFHFLAKEDLVRIPLLGHIIKKNCITLNRKQNLKKRDSFTQMLQSLEKNTSVLIFPEGTRNTGSERLLKFQNGAFKLSVASGKPILILSLWDTASLISKRGFYCLKPGKIHYCISKPIDPKQYNNDVEKLKIEARTIMLAGIDIMSR